MTEGPERRRAGVVLLFALGTVAIAPFGAPRAAELPTMRSPPQKEARKCNVGGMAGVVLPGSGVCVKIGGYVTGGVQAGNLTQPSK